jgi:hypothetical protein
VCKKNASIYLGRLQENAYSVFGDPSEVKKSIDDYYKNEAWRITEELKRKNPHANFDTPKQKFHSFLLSNTLPTKYEDKNFYSILDGLAHQIEDGFQYLNIQWGSETIPYDEFRKVFTPPSYGSLLTTELNAKTLLIPKTKNEFLVIFESDLFILCNLIAKLISVFFSVGYKYDQNKDKGENIHIISSLVEENIDKKIDQDDRLLSHFRALVKGYIVEGSVSIGTRYILEEQYMVDATNILRPIELFVLGHEYSHILCGHLGKATTISSALANQQVSESLYSWNHEFEADLNGLELMLAAAHKLNIDPSSAFCGSSIFFRFVDVLEHAKSIINTGDEKSYQTLNQSQKGSHPPPLLRAERLKQYFKNAHKNSPYGEHLLENCITKDKIVDALWENSVDYFYSLH